ncbi:MAG: PAS domain-containing protein [Gemmatimonas sp.]
MWQDPAATTAITATQVEFVKVVGSLLIAAIGGSVAFAVRELRRAKRSREADIKERVDQALAVQKRDKMLRVMRRELKAIRPNLETVLEKTKQIEYQVKPNGSGSMNDKIVAIASELSFEIAARRLTEHRAVFEGAVMLDGTVRAISVSQQWTRITGLRLEDMQHDNWPRCIAPEHYDRVMKAAEASKSGRPFHEVYDVINVENGLRTTVLHTAFPIPAGGGSHKIGWWVANLIPQYPTSVTTANLPAPAA